MPELPDFIEHSGDTHSEMMRATYVALCDHGYSDLTIQRIGDKSSKSKSLLYHHYDSKDELLLDFLEFMVDQMEDRITGGDGKNPDQFIDDILGLTFGFGNSTVSDELVRAMIELRSQAAHDADYQDHFTRSDRFVRKHIAHTIRTGIDQGVFRDVDPEETAALIQNVFLGTMMLRATNGDEEALTKSRAAFERYAGNHLLADE